GSAEVDARVRPLAEHEHGVYARIFLARAVPAAAGDHLVLRDVGRDATVAGGEILDPNPPPLRTRARIARVEELRARAASPRDELIGSMDGSIAVDGGRVRLASHAPRADDPKRAAALDDLRTFQPPSLSELGAHHSPEVVRALIQDGTIVRIDGDIVFSAEQV